MCTLFEAPPQPIPAFGVIPAVREDHNPEVRPELVMAAGMQFEVHSAASLARHLVDEQKIWAPEPSWPQQKMANARIPMIYSEQLKEMVSAIRNVDAHSPPPMDRPEDEFPIEYHMMVAESEKKQPSQEAYARICEISPRMPKAKRKKPNDTASTTTNKPTLPLLNTIHAPVPTIPDLQHIRPPSPGSPQRPGSPHRTNAENLRHDPVFESGKEFFLKLKAHFMDTLWFDEVDQILGRELSADSLVYIVAERVVRPSEFFYTIAAEEFMAHDNFVDFLVVLKQRVGPEWDERLTQPAHVFFVTAKTASKVVGVFGGRRLDNADLMDHWDMVLERCREAIDNSVMSPTQRENDIFFDAFLREGQQEANVVTGSAMPDPFLSLGDQMDLCPSEMQRPFPSMPIDSSPSTSRSQSPAPQNSRRRGASSSPEYPSAHQQQAKKPKKRSREPFSELGRWQEVAAAVSRRIRQRTEQMSD